MSGWVVIYNSSSLNDVEIVKAVLEDNQIDAVIVNKQDTMHLNLINGATQLIALHVNSKDAIKAKHLITKLEL